MQVGSAGTAPLTVPAALLPISWARNPTSSVTTHLADHRVGDQIGRPEAANLLLRNAAVLAEEAPGAQDLLYCAVIRVACGHLPVVGGVRGDFVTVLPHALGQVAVCCWLCGGEKGEGGGKRGVRHGQQDATTRSTAARKQPAAPVLICCVNIVARKGQPLGFLRPSHTARYARAVLGRMASSWVRRMNCGVSRGDRPPGASRLGHMQLLRCEQSQLYQDGSLAASGSRRVQRGRRDQPCPGPALPASPASPAGGGGGQSTREARRHRLWLAPAVAGAARRTHSCAEQEQQHKGGGSHLAASQRQGAHSAWGGAIKRRVAQYAFGEVGGSPTTTTCRARCAQAVLPALCSGCASQQRVLSRCSRRMGGCPNGCNGQNLQ